MVDGHLNFDTKINTQGFTNGLSGMTKAADSLKGSFLKLGAVIAGAFSVKAITAFAKESKSLYDTQLEAEARLSQVMKNTMSATDEQIQSVKDYSSALQELGVIGDEIQLSGLQELGTYVENSESLKKMNVVLNDMLAQQYGLNATAESAVTISTMLGKVLDGQTGALSRYGYSFTEAQEQLLKYGTEEQRVATLAEVVEASVGGMNEALANTDAGRMKQLDNTVGDIKEQFGQAVYQIEVLFLPALKRLADALTKAAGLAQSVSSAFAKVFGSADTSKAVASGAQAAAESYSDMADSAEAAQQANEGSLASFDEINKISEDTAEQGSAALPDEVGAGGAAVIKLDTDTDEAEAKITAFLEKMKSGFDTVKTAALDIFDGIKSYISDNFGGIFAGIFAGLKDEGQELLGTFGQIWDDLGKLAEPLKTWFQTDLTTYWQTQAVTLGNILTGLFDSFNKVFSDIWNIAAYPMLEKFVTDGLPMITQFGTQLWATLDTAFSVVKGLFDKLWEDYTKPKLELLATVWTDTVSILKAKWDEYGKPIFDGLRESIETAADLVKQALDEWIKPVFDYAMTAADELWSEHLAPLLDSILGMVGDIIIAGQKIYNKFIAPVISWVVAKLAPVVTAVGKTIVGNISKRAEKIIDIFKGITTFVSGVFRLDFAKAWAGIRQIFKGAWELMAESVKAPINLIIGLVNGLTSGVAAGLNYLLDGVEGLINSLSDAVNSLSFEIPDWVPEVGGQVLGFDMPTISIPDIDIPEIPKLAQGTVVPANYGEFLAVLGDNRREAEVVSPVSAIKQAVMEAMVELGGAGRNDSKQPVVVKIMLDGRVVGQAVIDDINDRTKRNGRSPLK